jgi:putative aldouronate transport system substrate-binding protein
VPDASKEEKLNAALASNSIADLTNMNVVAMPSIRSSLVSGMFWDVEPFLADFPNLAKIDDTRLDAARVDGKLWGVPFQKPLARYGVLVRQDWLDKLGLEVPHTIDDLTEVAKAFVEEDPSGKGTTGFIDREESFSVGFRSLAGYFGAGDRWQLEGDQIIPTATSDPWKEAMEWYRGVYEAKAVNQEFVTMQKQNQQDAIAQDKGGIVVTGLFEAPNYVALAEKIDPDTEVEWTLINDITYRDVPRRIVSDTAGGMGGLLAISSQSMSSEDDVKHVLGFIDKLLDEEAFNLMTNGIEGTHYEIDEDGAYTITDQTKWEQEVQPYSGSRPSDNVAIYKSTDEYKNLANEMMEENDQYAVTNPAQQLTSATYDSSWATIEQTLQDAYGKYITGSIDMAGYEKVIEGQRSQGLDDIIAEFTEAYSQVAE